MLKKARSFGERPIPRVACWPSRAPKSQRCPQRPAISQIRDLRGERFLELGGVWGIVWRCGFVERPGMISRDSWRLGEALRQEASIGEYFIDDWGRKGKARGKRAPVEAPLKKNQPVHRMSVPSECNTTDCCGMGFTTPFSNRPFRGPITYAATTAAVPPVRWTVPEPAKSITPHPNRSRDPISLSVRCLER